MQLPRDNKDLADHVNRKLATVPDKLAWICDQAAAAQGRDPRGGGFSFVGQPAVIEHVVRMLKPNERRMQRPIVIGAAGAEIVAWWVPSSGQHIPFRCSYRVKDADTKAQIWCLPDDLLVASDQVDRRAASEIRVAILKGELQVVQ